MLDVQYRMHPSISRFPSLEFYDFSLQDGTVDSAGNIHPMLLPPLSSHLEQNALTGHRPSVVFIDHAGSETSKDRSRVNWNEAHIVCSIIEDLLLQNEVSVAWLPVMSDRHFVFQEPVRTEHRRHRPICRSDFALISPSKHRRQVSQTLRINSWRSSHDATEQYRSEDCGRIRRSREGRHHLFDCAK